MAKNGIFVSLFGSGTSGKNGKPSVQRERVPEKPFQPERTVRQQQVLRQDQGLCGKVFILSLVEFYDAIGGRSGRLAESLLTICDTVFADRMGSDDGYSMVGEDQYVFRFSGCDDRQSLMRAAAIIEEIGTKMLGDHFVKSGKFQALLTAVGLDDIADPDGGIDAGKVSMAVEMARALPPEPQAPDEPAWVRLGYAGLTRDDVWAAVPSRRKDEIQWVSLDYKPKKQETQWQTLEVDKDHSRDELRWQTLERDAHKKPDPSLQWQVLDHKKPDRDVDWRYQEVRKHAERRAVQAPDGGARPGDRRNGPDRRQRPFVHMGARERRSGADRRRVGARRFA